MEKSPDDVFFQYSDPAGNKITVTISVFISVKESARQFNTTNSQVDFDVNGLPTPNAVGFQGYYDVLINKDTYLLDFKIDAKDTTLDPLKRDKLIAFAKAFTDVVIKS